MMKKLLVTSLILVSAAVFAEEDWISSIESSDQELIERDPAAAMSTGTPRTYPGGKDEEDLRVQTYLPDALLKSDARVIQREVYKSLYNEELSERQDVVEE